MVRIAFHYLGCRLNEAENEAIARSMTDKGHEIVAIADNPDVIVLNTCGVTADAMRKSRNLMRRFAAAGARLLVLMGCRSHASGREFGFGRRLAPGGKTR